MDDIDEIVRIFFYKDTEVVQVRLINGKKTNMMVEDVKQHRPQLYLEFCEEMGIAI